MVVKGMEFTLVLPPDGNNMCIPMDEFGKRFRIVEFRGTSRHTGKPIWQTDTWNVSEDMIEPLGGPW